MRGVEYCALCFSMHSAPSFPVFMFWSTGTRLAPPAVKEACCISRKCRTYTLQWIWQHVEAVFNATFLLNGSDESQWSIRIKAADCWFESRHCGGLYEDAENWRRILAVKGP